MRLLQKKFAKYNIPQIVKEKGLYSYYHSFESGQDTEVIVNGEKALMFGSNSYLGLTNHPEINQNLMLFPTDKFGSPTTFSLKEKPYVEASVGIGNIFKFFRIDLIRRMSYLDNPNVPEYGIRGRFKFDF